MDYRRASSTGRTVRYNALSMINEKDRSRLSGYNAKGRSKQEYSEAQMRKALKDAAANLSGPLTREAYQQFYDTKPLGAVPHSYTVIRRYGKWSDALSAAGLTSLKRATYKRRFSHADCTAALLRARQILGHLPSGGEYNNLWKGTYPHHGGSLKEEGHPSGSTIRVEFGTWRNACHEAAQQIP
jgi:hypothetical protein